MRWERLKNGDLLAVAEAAGFEAPVTGDQSLFYQQNDLKRRVAPVVIAQTKRRLVLAHSAAIEEAVSRARPGSYELLSIPNERRGIRAVE